MVDWGECAGALKQSGLKLEEPDQVSAQDQVAVFCGDCRLVNHGVWATVRAIRVCIRISVAVRVSIRICVGVLPLASATAWSAAAHVIGSDDDAIRAGKADQILERQRIKGQ